MERVGAMRRKSLVFAKRMVRIYQYLTTEKKEFVLSKQIVRSGTSIGANLAEARCGYSLKDFLAKIYIALKECAETLYWLDLLHDCDYLPEEDYIELKKDCEELRKMLSATTKTVRRTLNS